MINRYLPSFARRSRLSKADRMLFDENKSDISDLKLVKQKIEQFSDKHIKLEIGFGNGTHLVQRAIDDNQSIFIGCEIYTKGIVDVMKAIQLNNIQNIVLFNGDARCLLENLPSNILETVYILFPDPWPKKRHHKRRLISITFLNFLITKLKCDGQIVIATDHESYSNHILRLLQENHFKYHRDIPSNWIQTKYQMKSSRKSHSFDYFLVTK